MNTPATAKYKATIFSSVVNLSNTILGSGMLAMPAAFAAFGLLLGNFLVLFSALMSMSGLYLLSLCATQTPTRKSSFNSVALTTYEKATLFVDLAIAIKCFGVGISYLVIVGDLMPSIMNYLGHSDGFLINPTFWVTIFYIPLIPVVFLKKLDSLKFTSSIALFFVVYLVIIVIYYFFIPSTIVIQEHYKLIDVHLSSFAKFPLFVFGFTCHQNVFSIYNELKDNNQKQVNKIIFFSIFNGFLVYQIVGTLGYIQFGSLIKDNILSMFQNNLVISIGRFGVVFLSLFSFPLQSHPCRASITKIVQRFHSQEEYQHIDNNSAEFNSKDNLVHIIITIAILILSYIFAILLAGNLGTVLSFVGSTGSTTISFILPGLFYLKMVKIGLLTYKRFLSYWAKFLVTYGIFVMCFCLFFNVEKLIV